MISAKKQLDIQGHRGARGLYPENTLTAFIEALKIGVNTLEMDVVISKDKQVVVSHEPWMNELYCSQPNGEPVEKDSKEKYNLYKMTYAEIAAYDCGKRGNALFPQQKAMPERKPLLSEMIEKVESFIQTNKLPAVAYNIETKSESWSDGVFHPEPVAFVELLYTQLKKYTILHKTIVQSFDVRTLQLLRKLDPAVKTSLLVENTESLDYNLQQLGFIPEVYSPDFTLINAELIYRLSQLNVQLLPWTVNEISDMKRLVEMGVDGFITDYPDRAVSLVRGIN